MVCVEGEDEDENSDGVRVVGGGFGRWGWGWVSGLWGWFNGVGSSSSGFWGWCLLFSGFALGLSDLEFIDLELYRDGFGVKIFLSFLLNFSGFAGFFC